MTYYHFNAPNGPTESNLSLAMEASGWQKSKEKAGFTDLNLLSDNALSCFEHKHKLHAWCLNKGLDFMPQTWVLDELFLHQSLEKLTALNLACQWILKPALLNNGAGIRIFSTLEAVKAHFRQTDRYAGLHVIQAYIDPPLLIDNKKFSLRMLVVLSENNGLYLHPEGYLNVCNTPYLKGEYHALSAHLTNEHLTSEGKANNVQCLTSDWPLYRRLFPEISRQCQALFTPYTFDGMGKNRHGFLGVDFMLDENKRLWLLEVNHGPCFPTATEHPLFESLYRPFWRSVVRFIS